MWPIAALVLLASGCGAKPASIEWQAPAMGARYSVMVANAPRGITRTLLQADAEAVLAQIDRVFSTYRTDSEISRFNASGSTDWQAVSPELAQLVAEAERVSQATEGAFDITVGPLLRLWGFGPEFQADPRLPDAAVLASVRQRVGYRKLRYRLQPPALRKTIPELELDLNALVAGYAADRVAAGLEQRGVRNYLVDMGGELRFRGHNAQGDAWSIAIEQPSPGTSRVARRLKLRDCAVASSGDYRNFFELDGQRYAHVLDARTGQPIRHELASVTVLSPMALQADLWATALLVLGPVEGLRLARALGVSALFITRQQDGLHELASADLSHCPAGTPARTVLPPPG